MAKRRPSDLTDDEKIERLWEALMFACMELKGDPADALVHALDIYNHKAPEMLRMRKARAGKGLDARTSHINTKSPNKEFG
jgi:hypothetical protein